MLGWRQGTLAPLLLALVPTAPALAADPILPDLRGSVELASPLEVSPTSTLDYNRGGIFDEVRIGSAAAYQDNDEGTEDAPIVHGQVLFDPLLQPLDNRLLDIFLRPRPHVGGLVSFGGTSQLFAGVTWNVPLGPFFLEASFGGTIHDGTLDTPPEEDGVALGCRLLFRESVGAGVHLGRNWTIMAQWDHASHADLCGEDNNGLTHIGGSIGYRF